MESMLMPTISQALVALYLLLVLGTVGAPMLSLLLEIHGHRKRMIFAVKLAQQIDRMGISLLLVVLLIGAVAHALLLPGSPLLPGLWSFLTPSMLLLLLAPFALLLMLWTGRTMTWNRMKKQRPRHILLGLLTVLCLLVVVVILAGVKRHLLLQDPDLLGPLPLPELFSWPSRGLVWPALAHFLIAGMGAASALGEVYLILRRTREDFGRDYYNWSMAVVARWSLLFMLGQLVLLPWYFFWAGPSIPGELFPVIGAAILALFLASGVWFLLIRSKTPMRYKGLVLASVVLILVSLVAAVLTASAILELT
jgi:hypothetical protein